MGFIFRLIRNILAIIGLITVIVAIVIGVVAYMFIHSLGSPSEIENSMRSVEITDEAADSFDLKWDNFTSVSGAVQTLKLTEAEVSSKAYKIVDELNIPLEVDKVWVNFDPGSVHAKVAIIGNIFGISIHVAAEGEFQIVEEEDGTKVLQLKIVDYSLPERVKNLIEDNISERFDFAFEPGVWQDYELPDDWDLDISDISVQKVGEEYQLWIDAEFTGEEATA